MEDYQQFPNLNHLYYFYAVAREGSIRQAAEKLGLTEPTISKQVRQLEDFLDTTLFHRESGGMRLTAAGQRAYDEAASAFRSTRRLMQLCRKSAVAERFHLHVGVTSTINHIFAADYFLPLLENDEIYVNLRYGDYGYQLQDLLSGEIDILLSDTRPDALGDHDLSADEVHWPQLVGVADEALAAEIGEFPDGLDDKPFIHYTPHARYRFEIDQTLKLRGIAPNVIAESDDVSVMRAAAERGLAAAIIPRTLAQRGIADDRLCQLGVLEEIDSTVWALYQSLEPPEPVIAAIAALRQERPTGS